MIDHHYHCVFIHQRKCAGSSIIQTFGYKLKDPDWHFANDGILSPEWAEIPKGYFKFAVMRNPWGRFVSGWKFLRGLARLPLRTLLEHMPEHGLLYRHLTRPQYATLYTPDGELAVDKLIRFENLQAGFDEVCDTIGRPRSTVPHDNRTEHKPYQEYFDAEARKLFDQIFARDIELFGYKFEG
jgi:hypothetical protein